jgi:MFS family permease
MTLPQIFSVLAGVVFCAGSLYVFFRQKTRRFKALFWLAVGLTMVFAAFRPQMIELLGKDTTELRLWLVVALLALHGFCYVFFFTAAYIYVDNVAPKDIRASAQSLIAVIILGLGNFVGSLFCGWIQKLFTVESLDAAGQVVKTINWRNTFLVPTALTLICLVVFLAFFRDKKAPAAA